MEIKWNESYSVYNKTLDAQHQRLFEMFDTFQNALNNANSDKKALQAIIDGLKKYTIEHFATEEKHMAAIHYPHLELHKSKHKQFIEKVNEYEYRYRTGVIVLPTEIITFLKEWLIRHIYVEDKMYTKYEKGKE